MPKLTVEDARTVEVPQGKRLINALEDDVAIDRPRRIEDRVVSALAGEITDALRKEVARHGA